MSLELMNASRWGVWLAILFSLVVTLGYLTWITLNYHLLAFGLIVVTWIVVYAGVKMDLEI